MLQNDVESRLSVLSVLSTFLDLRLLCLSFCVPVCLLGYLLACLLICLFAYPFDCLCVHLSVNLSACLSVYLPFCLFILCACLPICLCFAFLCCIVPPVCQFFGLSVCLWEGCHHL